MKACECLGTFAWSPLLNMDSQEKRNELLSTVIFLLGPLPQSENVSIPEPPNEYKVIDKDERNLVVNVKRQYITRS